MLRADVFEAMIGPVWREALDLTKQLQLEVDPFRDGLDHEIAVVERLSKITRDRDASQQAIGIGRR